MSANDFLLFIDANKYLDLYRIDKGKSLLAPLIELKDYIFVNQQVLNEVQRNKVEVATKFLSNKSNNLKLQTFNLPEHFSQEDVGQRKDILEQMREVSQNVKSINTKVDTLVSDLIKQISRSEDEVSKALKPIFAKKISHSSEELKKARERRELGNPPGKKTDPLGDQLTWEQILTHFKGKKRLWIISRDTDYGSVYGDKSFLNCLLYNELCNVVSEPEVYLFPDLVTGIKHFVETTGVKAEESLTPEEEEEIEKEEKSLPSLRQQNEIIARAIENINQPFRQQNEIIAKAIENINQPFRQQNEIIARAIENINQPFRQQNEIIAKAIENINQQNQRDHDTP